MSLLNAIFPTDANNDYRGSRIAFWGFALITLITIGRSLVHIFKSDGGAQSIATIPLDTYSSGAAEAVVGIFAYWGISQLLFGLVFLLVLLRYRNLIPAMLLFIVVEYVARLASGQFKPIETVGQAPGGVVNYIFPVVALVLFYLALPKRRG